jgi:hypothetical protein
MEGPPTDQDEIIRAAASEFVNLNGELSRKRSAQKQTKGGLNAWRSSCVSRRVDPTVLVEAQERVLEAEQDPERAGHRWRLLITYLRSLGFFELLPGDLAAGHLDGATDRQVRASAVA